MGNYKGLLEYGLNYRGIKYIQEMRAFFYEQWGGKGLFQVFIA